MMPLLALTAAFILGVIVGAAGAINVHRNAHPTCPGVLIAGESDDDHEPGGDE